MTSVRRQFFIWAIVAVVGVSAAGLTVVSVQRRIAQKELSVVTLHARDLLQQARVSLLTPTAGDDVLKRAETAALQSDQASRLLREFSAHNANQGMLAAIGNVIPFFREAPQPPIALVTQALKLSEQLAWFQRALPALQRIGGYDASADVHAATDTHDLTQRVFLAREGLRKSIENIAGIPASFNIPELGGIQHDLKSAHDIAVPILQHLQAGDRTGADALLVGYVSSLGRASRASGVLVTRITSDAFLASLAPQVQRISDQ